MNNSYRSGFISLIGRPNVGKSTLLNELLGQKVAAVSKRPQTTRRRQLGILTLDQAQLVFMDNPGIHKPEHALGEFMNEVALQSIPDADVILWLVDGSSAPQEQDIVIAGILKKSFFHGQLFMVLTRKDLIPPEKLPERLAQYQALYPDAEAFSVSAYSKADRNALVEKMISHLPEGPQYYDEEQITDLYMRDIAADLIREAALKHLSEEIPHMVGVRVAEFSERSEQNAFIAAFLILDRENHKGIVIGRGGEMLKRIGTTAREQIEAVSGMKIYLELKVKVEKGWRNNPAALKQLGYAMPDEK